MRRFSQCRNNGRSFVINFQKGIEYFRKEIFAELPLQQLYMILLTAQNDGLAQQDFQQLLGVPGGTVSRNLAKLGTKIVEDPNGGVKDVGYGLIELRSDDDPKKNTVHLTKKGKRFMEQLDIILNGEIK